VSADEESPNLPPQSEEDALVEDVSDEPTGSIEALSYYGTDFDVHGLVRRLNAGEVIVPSFDPRGAPDVDVAGFQRKFVWTSTQMNRFIESLLLGFPVPGIFLVQQTDRKLLVLDGQQRLRTLQAFYEGEFRLSGVVSDFDGLAYRELDEEARRVLDNTFIHATVVKYNPDNRSSEEAVYQLFERLNTGGTNLYPHEIRVALYSGELVELVRELNSHPAWRALFGKRNSRLKDQELILRFLALYYDGDKYERPLRSFLNTFTKRHRHLEGLQADEIRRLFEATCTALNDGPGTGAFRAKIAINAALVDSVMVGMARRIAEKEAAPDPSRVTLAHKKLLEDEDFLGAIGRATADEERVKQRLGKATAAFAEC